MASADSSPANKSIGNFELICSLKANNLIPVHKYKSSLTGLTVVIAEVEGPVVNGYFCLATEAHDDDGLPHTLEHLIFLGSERYPFKGVLDLLANRCLASGTNAWTDTDHTCYTMTTAGSEGFLSLMPIYLDHILYPTLTNAGFTTEVHHVTGEGEDGGVVYCEMQGRENSGESLTTLALLRTIYPGKCGYKSETGGVLKNLRESTTNDKVLAYHKEFYRPENLTLIVTGQVKPEEVFKSLAIVEETIISKGDRGGFTRPWQDTIPPLTESKHIEILYPCDDEDNGMVYLAWRGPSAITELLKMSACSVLLKYLTDTSISPLQKQFVEIEDPYASKVSYNISENSECVLYLTFDSVPLEKLEKCQPALSNFLSELDSFDMPRLRAVIHRQILETLSSLENSPHQAVAFMLIGDMLYGKDEIDLSQRLSSVEDLHLLEEKPESFWLDILRQYLVNAPGVSVRGRPSIAKKEAMSEEESLRVAKQREDLGPAGLEAKTEQLLEAMQINEKPPTTEMLTSVAIPSIDSIYFHPLKSFTTDSEEQHEKFDLTKVPVYMHLDHVHTNFVYMFVLMNTAGVSRKLRPYLPLLLESLLELPVQRGNVLVPYEEVVTELEMDTISLSTGIGLEATSRFVCGPYSHTASLTLQLEPAKYERCIFWIRELLYQTKFKTDRLKVLAAKIINDVSQSKRKGHKIVGDLMRGLRFNKDSNHYNSAMLRQQKFLAALVEKLDTDAGYTEVIRDLEAVRAEITDPRHMVVHVSTDVDMLSKTCPNPDELWKEMLPANKKSVKNKLLSTPDWKLLNSINEPYISNLIDDVPGDKTSVVHLSSCIVGLGCVESCFFSQTTPCIRDFNDPDLAPLLVFLQYLTQLEGPMWRQIRGQGLAYSYNIVPRPNDGLLHLGFYRATNVLAAYKEAKSIVEGQLGSEAVWEQALFESAKSSLIFEIIERERSVGDVVAQSLLSYFKEVNHEYNRKLVQLISNVTEDSLKEVGLKYVSQLFDPSKCLTTITCHPTKTEEIANGFKELSLILTIHPTLEESFIAQW